MQMKRMFLGLTVSAFVLGSCVTKQKYNELQNDLTACNAERENLASQKINLDNRVNELGTEVEKMKNQIQRLEADTTLLGSKSRDLKEAHSKMQSDYDELSASYKAMSAGNKRDAEAMLARLQEAQTKLDEKERELKLLSEDLEKKNQDLNEKSAKLTELQAILDKKDAYVLALREKIKKALQGFEGSGLEVMEKNGKVYISMDEKLLFASGKFSIDNNGKEALKALAKVLESDTGISITVEGHTDNVPFTPASSAQIRDNWDLSVMRATTVVKTILEYGEINPERLTASGRSEYIPIDTENSKDARAKNRRTEIILTPQLDALFEILK
jgi:chemotaxis protein MotB